MLNCPEVSNNALSGTVLGWVGLGWVVLHNVMVYCLCYTLSFRTRKSPLEPKKQEIHNPMDIREVELSPRGCPFRTSLCLLFFQTVSKMAAIEGVSLHLWSSSSSCSLVFPSPTSSVVETLLSVLGNHRGVGQASPLLLQEARGLAMDSPGAWQQVEGAAVRVEAVQNIWVNKENGQGEEREIFV